MKYSSSWYPTLARLNEVPMIDGEPGPVIGPSTFGMGTFERGRVRTEGCAAAAVADGIAITAMTAAVARAMPDPRLTRTPHPPLEAVTAGDRATTTRQGRPRVWHF